MSKRSERERQQRRKYYRHMEEQRATEKERIAAMGMLLDAAWNGYCFVQYREAGGHDVVCYYDKKGNVIAPNTRDLWDKPRTRGREIPL